MASDLQIKYSKPSNFVSTGSASVQKTSPLTKISGANLSSTIIKQVTSPVPTSTTSTTSSSSGGSGSRSSYSKTGLSSQIIQQVTAPTAPQPVIQQKPATQQQFQDLQRARERQAFYSQPANFRDTGAASVPIRNEYGVSSLPYQNQQAGLITSFRGAIGEETIAVKRASGQSLGFGERLSELNRNVYEKSGIKKVYEWAEKKGYTEAVYRGSAFGAYGINPLALIPAFKPAYKAEQGFRSKFARAYVENIIKKPVTSTIIFGVGMGAGAATPLITSTSAGRVGYTIFGVGAATITVGTIGTSIAIEPKRTAEILGSTASTFTIGAAGFVTGTKVMNTYLSSKTKLDVLYKEKVMGKREEAQLDISGKYKGFKFKQETFKQGDISISSSKYKGYDIKTISNPKTSNVYVYESGKLIKAYTTSTPKSNIMLELAKTVKQQKIVTLKQDIGKAYSYVRSQEGITSKFTGESFKTGRFTTQTKQFEFQVNQNAFTKTTTSDKLVKGLIQSPRGTEAIVQNIKPIFRFGKQKQPKDIFEVKYDDFSSTSTRFVVKQPRSVSRTEQVITVEGKGTITTGLRVWGKKAQISSFDTTSPTSQYLTKPQVNIQSTTRLYTPKPNINIFAYEPASKMPFLVIPSMNSITRTTIKPISKLEQTPALITKPTTAQRPRTALAQTPVTITQPIEKLRTITIERIKPVTTYVTQLVNAPLMPITTGISLIVPPPIIPILKSPVFDMGGTPYRHSPIKSMRLKSKRAYQPTLYTAGFSIRGRESKRLTRTGLGIRPLPTIKESKKKAKKLKFRRIKI